MANPIYNPFKNFNFSNKCCFLSGDKITSPEQEISVFPLWLMNQYQLNDKPFKLLDESMATYKSLKLPVSIKVINQFEDLEEEIEKAFTLGCDAVKLLPEIKLFQWIGKIVYGILFNEIRIGISQQKLAGEQFELSQSLQHKFGNLHLMLQSFMMPVVFEGKFPWSIWVFRVNNSTDHFNYRDEINTLTFSLGMKDFGIIACLQDNGANTIYHKDILGKIDKQPLHPIQFEEICGRFFYSNYLFNRLPEYTVIETQESVYIESMPLKGTSNKPLFDNWQNKTYCQVLENFWKPWGFNIFEIQKDPENPMTFLLETDGVFKLPEAIDLPF